MSSRCSVALTFCLMLAVRMAPVSDPLFAGHELSLQRGAHFLPHVGRAGEFPKSDYHAAAPDLLLAT